VVVVTARTAVPPALREPEAAARSVDVGEVMAGWAFSCTVSVRADRSLAVGTGVATWQAGSWGVVAAHDGSATTVSREANPPP